MILELAHPSTVFARDPELSFDGIRRSWHGVTWWESIFKAKLGLLTSGAATSDREAEMHERISNSRPIWLYRPAAVRFEGVGPRERRRIPVFAGETSKTGVVRFEGQREGHGS